MLATAAAHGDRRVQISVSSRRDAHPFPSSFLLELKKKKKFIDAL
jgi:hypothetical protein